MLSHHAWHRSMQRLDGIIDSVLARKSASRAGAARPAALGQRQAQGQPLHVEVGEGFGGGAIGVHGPVEQAPQLG
jgi:hypothetical protein